MNETCNKIIKYLLDKDVWVSYSELRTYLNYDRKTDNAKETLHKLEVIDIEKKKNGDEELEFYKIPELKRVEIDRLPKKYKHIPYEYFSSQEKRTWEEKHPFWDRARTGFITFLFAIGSGIIIYTLTTAKRNQAETLQDKRLDSLSDSVTIFQKHIKDSSLHKH